MSKFKFIACCALVVLEKGARRERNGPTGRTHCWELSWVALDEIGLKVKWKSMALRLTGGRQLEGRQRGFGQMENGNIISCR